MHCLFLLQLILNAKCHAIRDAQLIEKVEIKKEQLEEEKRLDEMMEVERLNALKEYEEREKAAHFERLKGAQVLQQQITDREQSRLLDEEKKDQETKVGTSNWFLNVQILTLFFFNFMPSSLKPFFDHKMLIIIVQFPLLLPLPTLLEFPPPILFSSASRTPPSPYLPFLIPPVLPHSEGVNLNPHPIPGKISV